MFGMHQLFATVAYNNIPNVIRIIRRFKTQTCPGIKSLRIIGSPLIKASAIVPGPAYRKKCYKQEISMKMRKKLQYSSRKSG
jgi:hypothetical protein